jgi:hypothetical protein
MGLEGATYISDLVVTNPVGATDPKSQGDDHIRLIKSVLKNTFPNINSVVNATDEQINFLVGVTALIENMRGLANSNQGAPYTIAAGDIGNCVSITGAGTVTLPNLADNFACTIEAIGGDVVLTSTSGTLSWLNGAGSAAPTGNVTILRSGVVTVHRVSGNWRVFGGGLTP